MEKSMSFGKTVSLLALTAAAGALAYLAMKRNPEMTQRVIKGAKDTVLDPIAAAARTSFDKARTFAGDLLADVELPPGSSRLNDAHEPAEQRQ